ADGTGPAVGRRAPGSIDLSLAARPGPDAPALVDRPTDVGARDDDEARRLGLRAGGGGTYGYEDTHFRAKIGRDGTVELEDRLPMPRVGTKDGLPSVELPVDLNDTIMRLAGDDPYQYEKAKMMAATRPLREKLADAACREDLREAVLRIRPSLEQLWAEDAVSITEKRRRIFQLWDQCAEEGSDDVLLATEQIRAIIVDFVQQKLPRSSPVAFAPEELALLNEQRRSKRAFSPYAQD
ncbi:hypothetical protein L6R52_22710, partial [Myxococcota bacterium]|nr:hypothetical protein [Myxococcota bacterium]